MADWALQLVDAIGYGHKLDVENDQLRDRARWIYEEWAALTPEVRGRIAELAPDLTATIMDTQP